jgi:hypothetical protein
MMNPVNIGNVVEYRIGDYVDTGVVHDVFGYGKRKTYCGIAIDGTYWSSDEVTFKANSLAEYLRSEHGVTELV